MKRAKASVVWELLEFDGGQRLVVDVDAPLRPFGADPTPPHGTKAPGASDKVASLGDDTLDDLEVAVDSELPRSSATEALVKALRQKVRSD